MWTIWAVSKRTSSGVIVTWMRKMRTFCASLLCPSSISKVNVSPFANLSCQSSPNLYFARSIHQCDERFSDISRGSQCSFMSFFSDVKCPEFAD